MPSGPTGTLLQALAFASLPIVGNAIGALLAESIAPPRWVTGAALHAAAGVAIALVSVDLMPRILNVIPMSVIVSAFLAGALFSVLLARGLVQLGSGRFTSHERSAWMVFAAVAADLVSDGLITGAGTAIGATLGFLVAASQAIANVPGGFAAVANLREAGVKRRSRLLVTGTMIIPVAASATGGFWLLGSADLFLQSAALAFISGILLLATVEDVLPQGDAPQPARWISTSAFAIGFAGLATLSSIVD